MWAEPARGSQVALELHLTPVQLLRIVKSLDFLAPVRIHNDQFQAGSVGTLAGFATDELAATLEEEDQPDLSNKTDMKEKTWSP